MNNSSFGLENDSGNIVERILVQIFSTIFGVIAFFGNSLVVFVIGKFPAIRKEIPCIYLIGYLALTDGFTGWFFTVFTGWPVLAVSCIAATISHGAERQTTRIKSAVAALATLTEII